MEFLLAIVFGVVQGITEFLPISSSGHLLLLHKFFDLPVSNEMAFDVALHFATVLAVILAFWSEIKKLVKSFLLSLMGKHDEYSKTSWLILLATIPAGLSGVLFEDLIESATRENEIMGVSIVALMLVVIAVLFIIIEKRPIGGNTFTQLKWGKALSIGFAQALALIPGTSRSGVTIIAGIMMGLKRDEAIKFSFLLSIPIILGASLVKIPDLFHSTVAGKELVIISIAFLSSFLAGYFAIKFLLRYTKNNTLNAFAYYRIALAVVLLIYLLSI